MTAEQKIIREKIKEVNDYFVNKILNQQFEIDTIDRHTACLNVDGYKFTIWIANTHMSLRCYEYLNNFMDLTFNESQKKEIHKFFNDILKQRKREILEAQKQKIEETLKTL